MWSWAATADVEGAANTAVPLLHVDEAQSVAPLNSEDGVVSHGAKLRPRIVTAAAAASGRLYGWKAVREGLS